MTLLDVEELCGYWADHPPIHLMVAGYLGIKPAQHKPVGLSASDVLSGLPAGALIERDVHEGLSGAAILDFAELKRRTSGA